MIDDFIIKRHPRSKLPLTPVIIFLVIFIAYDYVSTSQESVHILIDSVPVIVTYTAEAPQIDSHHINLHDLVSRGTYEVIVEQLNEIDEVISGMTPIMLAPSRGRVEIVDLLFMQGVCSI